MTAETMTGGCQCGAVRFSAALPLGRASLCHCRMCQKAFGSFFAPLVSAESGMAWTRGQPAWFRSSNRASRGFCAACGTPLCYQPEAGVTELAIGAFDDPAVLRPTAQHGVIERMPWFAELIGLPERPYEEVENAEAWLASIVSYQHPDQDAE